jgi:hypothetical protein
MMRGTLQALASGVALAMTAAGQDGRGIADGQLQGLDLASVTATPIGTLTQDFEGIASTPFGYDYAITWMGDLYRVVQSNGRATLVEVTGVPYVSALAYDVGAHAVFFTHKVPGGHGLTRLDLARDVRTYLGLVGAQIVGMDVSPLGELFAWDSGTIPGEGDGLVLIDKVTGVVRNVNPEFGGPVDVMWMAFRGEQLFCGRESVYAVDPVTGITSYVGSFLLTDLYTLDFDDAELGTAYCGAVPNSTGMSARLRAFGSTTHLTLLCEHLPPDAVAFVIAGPSQGFIPFPGGSQGFLCVVGELHRLLETVARVPHHGFVVGRPAVSALPIVSGATWRFQTWYKEPTGAANFSLPVALTFL